MKISIKLNKMALMFLVLLAVPLAFAEDGSLFPVLFPAIIIAFGAVALILIIKETGLLK
jgi:hypothetical protein